MLVYVFEGKSIIQRAYKIIRIRLYLGNRGGTFRLPRNWFVSTKYCNTKAKLIIAFCSSLLSEIPFKLLMTFSKHHETICKHQLSNIEPFGRFHFWSIGENQSNKLRFLKTSSYCAFLERQIWWIGLMSCRCACDKLNCSRSPVCWRSKVTRLWIYILLNHKNTILFIFCLSSIEHSWIKRGQSVNELAS